jgi:ATP-dependent Clp protease ATP-binding subunit ClpA
MHIGRQFPDKAIDLIDEACTIIARKNAQIDNQAHEKANQLCSLAYTVEETAIVPECSSRNRAKEAIVNPNHVAQVGTLSF